MGGWLHKLRDIMHWDGELTAKTIRIDTGDKIYIGPDSYLTYENGKVTLYSNGIKKVAW